MTDPREQAKQLLYTPRPSAAMRQEWAAALDALADERDRLRDVESAAFRMWRHEAIRAAPNVAKRRTPKAFRDESSETRDRWLGLARAALREGDET